MNTKNTKMVTIVIVLIGVVGLLMLNNKTQTEPSSTAPTQPTTDSSAPTKQVITQVTLYHWTGEQTEYQSQIKTIPPTPRIADATLKLLFQTYLPTLTSEYINVSLVEGVATVDFKQGAHAYLDQAAAGVSAEYTNSIEKTLLQFSTIYRVQFAIDGKVIIDWDA